MRASALLWLSLLIGCAKPAGGPLKHTFDNTKIAAVPLEAKQAVTQAQQEHDLALLQRTNAETESRDAEVERDLAEYQADRALVITQLAANRRGAATPATAESAAAARTTAAAKVEFMRARRAWLAKLASSSLYGAYAAQAKLELERAKVAQANNAVAPGFDLQVFQRQHDERDQAARGARDATETARKEAEAKLAAWAEAERAFMQAAGITGPAESGRYAAEWKAAAGPATPPAPKEPAAPPTPATDAAAPAAPTPSAAPATPTPPAPKP